MPLTLFDVYFRNPEGTNIYFIEDRREDHFWKYFVEHFDMSDKDVLYFPLYVIKKQTQYPLHRFYYSTDGEDDYSYFREEKRFER